jgi:hypothetical protein
MRIVRSYRSVNGEGGRKGEAVDLTRRRRDAEEFERRKKREIRRERGSKDNRW